MKRMRGFTIIEIAVVIMIIAVLVTLTVTGYNRAQANARNDASKSKSTIISEALEKYYERTGEYPTCAQLTAASSTVTSTTLQGIDADILTRSGAAGTNSINCTDPANGGFTYIGNSDGYTLSYKEDATGNIVTFNSRHKAQGEVVNKPTIAIALDGSNNPVATASASQCKSAQTKYSFRYQTNGGAWSSYGGWDTSNIATLAGTPGYKYAYQVQVQCGDGSTPAPSDPSSTVTVPVPTPAAPSLLASVSGANAVGTASGTCPANTSAIYSFQSVERPSAGAGTWSAWSGYGSGNTVSVTANQVWQYSFGAKLVCRGQFADSAPSAAVTASTPTATVSSSANNITATATADACASGTLEYSFSSSTNDAAWTAYDAWSSSNTRAISGFYGYKYNYRVQTRCTGAPTDVEVGTKPANGYIVPVPTPGVPNIAVSVSGTTVNFTVSGAPCGVGTTWKQSWILLDRTTFSDNSWDYWRPYTTTATGSIAGNQGWQYNIQSRIRCDGLYANSAEGPGQVGAAVVPFSTPPAPSWAGVASFRSGNGAIYPGLATYTTYCPVGSTVVAGSNTFDSHAQWDSTKNYTHTYPYNDWWYNQGVNYTVYVLYNARYRCETSFTTSPVSPDSSNMIAVTP